MSRRLVHSVLAIWTVAASTCCEVAHAHDDAGEPHAHHLGLVALTPAGQYEPAGRHWHLVLFGIETGSLPADPCGGDGDDESGVTVGLDCARATATAGAAPETVPPPDAGVLLPPLPEPTQLARHPVRPSSDGALRSACAKAAHARSGVRLA